MKEGGGKNRGRDNREDERECMFFSKRNIHTEKSINLNQSEKKRDIKIYGEESSTEIDKNSV